MDVEAAGEAGEEAGERERAETLPVDRDADGPGGGGILAGRAELAPKRLRWYANAAAITSNAPIVACRRSVVSGTDENVFSPGPIFS